MKNLFILFILLISFDCFSKSILKNNGQISDTRVLYYSEGKEWKIYFLNDRISFVKTEISKQQENNQDYSHSLRFDLIPEFKNPKLKLEEIQNSTFNFILNKKQIKAESYSKITYQSKEFDIVFYESHFNELKYDIIYHSNNVYTTKKVSFKLEGITDLKLEENDLIIQTLLGHFSINIPLAYTDIFKDNKIFRKKKKHHHKN